MYLSQQQISSTAEALQQTVYIRGKCTLTLINLHKPVTLQKIFDMNNTDVEEFSAVDEQMDMVYMWYHCSPACSSHSSS